LVGYFTHQPIQEVEIMDTLKDHQEEVKRYTSARTGLPESLRISAGPNGLTTWYAPFEYINRAAKIVLCGITPGLQQADAALVAARDALLRGESVEAAQVKAKATGSFAGVMRTNLVSMLDHVGVNRLVGISSCSELFGMRSDLVHYTSALRNPVFKDGENYSGDSKMVRSPYLWDQILAGIKEESGAIPGALWVPLGPDVGAVFERLIGMGVIEEQHCLLGLPHASGANSERIKYFLGEKPRELLSSRTNAQLIDSRKRELLEKIAGLTGGREFETGSNKLSQEYVSLPDSREPRLDVVEKEPVIVAKVTRGKNKGKTLRPHRHPDAENRFVVTKTRFKEDYIYLNTLVEVLPYLKRGYGLRMSIPDSNVPASLIIPASITVG
jgi:hypothetical protein